MTDGKYDVVVADDHALFRDGLGSLLENCCNCRVAGAASDGKELLDLLPGCPCDVVLMDIDMPVMNGIDATRLILEAYPDMKIIALSMHGEEEYYFRMVEAGAKGFLLKNSGIDQVRAAIETVCAGGNYFSQELLQTLVSNLKSTGSQSEQLSDREKEILPLICRGFSNQEIADSLYISKRTVDKHRANILSKTGSRNTANLVMYAIKNRLVEL